MPAWETHCHEGHGDTQRNLLQEVLGAWLPLSEYWRVGKADDTVWVSGFW